MSRRIGGSKDIRNKIKHSNANLGEGVELQRAPTQSIPHTATGHHGFERSPTPHGGQDYANVPMTAGAPSFLQQHQQQQQPHHLGAGPSFVSLTPSDSVSNFEGRPSHQHSYSQHAHTQSQSARDYPSLFPRPPSPTADSTASFARNLNEGDHSMAGPSHQGSSHTPNRPKRSMRRPMAAPTLPPSALAAQPQFAPANGRNTPSLSIRPPPEDQHGPAPTGDRHARSARLMAQVNHGPVSGRETPADMHSEDESLEDAYGGLSPMEATTSSPFFESPSTGKTTSPMLGSLSKEHSPAALSSVLAALSQAGRKHQGRRIMRGMTADEESRRRKVERRMDEARKVEFRDLKYYEIPDDEASGIGRIGTVLRKVKAEWGFVAEDDFNSVALALSLLDDSSLGSNRDQFESMKELIEDALQGTVDDHYESFATAITLHNSVLSSLTNVQTSVSSARRRLRDSRDALGSKRADLVQLWHRQQNVKEALRLLNTVEQLKNVPDRLETLIAEKHFLTAVNLLMRALKTIDKPEMVEIGATADLRSYLRSQEGHMLEILVDEIHNHLYLKSIYCDRRWRGYSPGEVQLPDVKWGREYEKDGKQDEADDDDELESSQPKISTHGGAAYNGVQVPAKLSRYLESLSNRRMLDTSKFGNDFADLERAGYDFNLQSADSESMPKSSPPGHDGAETPTAAEEDAMAAAEFDENPESDSFLYLEMILEALARLGKLSVALDAIHQRLPVEIHALVESTIREVESRTEPLRRSGTALRPESILLASSSALARTFGENGRSSFRSSYGPSDSRFSAMSASASSRPLSTILRLSATESSQVESDGEVMRDLFWTLFSKLDAVLQGHRVVHEVAGQISQRSGFKESGQGQSTIAEKLRGRLVGGERLLEVWRPIQMEVRTLLHEYLMDDTQSPTSRRNNMISINEVLRQGTFNRDKSKKLFHLSEQQQSLTGQGSVAGTTVGGGRSGAGTSTSRRDLGPVKRHEEALNGALRAFVPGLVNAAETGSSGLGLSSLTTSLATQQREHQILVSSTMSGDSYNASVVAGNHRLLVKPDAFNISVLFQPALAFVDRVRVVMPSDAAGETSKGFSAFLDEFVQDVFLPQLEDKVQALFQGAVGGGDAFQEDPASRGVSSKPLIKSAVNVVVLIDSLYSMLCTTPFHRESYSRLIIQTIVQFYSRCHERYRELVAFDSHASRHDGGGDGSGQYMLSSEWAQNPQLAQVLAELIDIGLTLERKSELQREENFIEVQLAARNRGETVNLDDLITSRKKLLALGNLTHSLRWFLKHISRLKATDESLPVSSRPQARLSVMNGVHPVPVEQQEFKLPLASDMAARYETLPRTYRHLTHTILFTLRMELRARALHHLDLAIMEGNYLVEESAAEPDPHIVDLNAELASLDDILADTVAPEDHRFLFDGLASLIDQVLIASVRKVRAINRPGVSKMIRNVVALQQNLKNIVISDTVAFATPGAGTGAGAGVPSTPLSASASQVNFDASRRFWELLSKSPSEMLAAVKRETQASAAGTAPVQKYGFEEIKSALNLMLGLDNGPVGSASIPTSASSGQVAAAMGAMGLGGSSSSSSSSGSAPRPETPRTPTTPTRRNSISAAAGGSSLLPRAGTVALEGPGGATVSRQKFNEYLIELHQVLEADE